jgi:two-component system, sensor histidine kinase YesM
LTYSFEIEEALMDIEIPKLIIQPLVENSLKFGSFKEPPWDIYTSGKILDGYWQISVQLRK